jgi:hypothetical protein
MVVVNVSNNFTHMVKEIELKKMEMTKFIRSQMLQNEENGKQIMIQGQLHLDVLFADVLNSKTTNGSASSGN